METAKTYLASWRSEKAEQHFREVEAQLWQETGTTPEHLTAQTRFGSTHVYHWPGSGTPLVLLHGMGDTSRRWVPHAKALQGRNIYSPDIMGEVGRSNQSVGFSSAADYGIWLDETLAALDVERAHIIGMSLGGYVALELATLNPERVESLVLFDPLGIVKLRLGRLMRWSAKTGLAMLAPERTRVSLAKRLGMPALENKADARLLRHAQFQHPIAMPPIEPLDDDQLRQVIAPVHLVAGGKSQAFDAEPMTARICELVPTAEIDVLPNAGHALALTDVDYCVDVIVRAIESD